MDSLYSAHLDDASELSTALFDISLVIKDNGDMVQKKLDERLVVQRNYLIFLAKNTLQMGVNDIAAIFKITRQMVHEVLTSNDK